MITWQKKKHRIWMRALALVMAGVFLSSNIGLATAAEDLRAHALSNGKQEKGAALPIPNIRIPAEYGRIVESYQAAPSSKLRMGAST